MTKNKYTERLSNEWKMHGKIVLAIDFDSTLRYWKTIDNQEDIDRVIKVVKDCQNVGCFTTIHTACNPDRYDEIKDYCNSLGIKVDSININPVKMVYGKNAQGEDSKIFYNHQLCDRSGLIESLNILEEAMYLQRAYNYSTVNRAEIG